MQNREYLHVVAPTTLVSTKKGEPEGPPFQRLIAQALLS
ncbi:hypothetical protein DT23_15460 [Thioclava indica]|uniref:Uncharacterized protein n=1 Tax=Thioclava indica TaxID=1353528 RepID=A0A074KEE1_9RHOB|nr:hypothetical protein DT23_15460 [Thioclava indica]